MAPFLDSCPRHGINKNAVREKNILRGNKKYTGSRVNVCIKKFLWSFIANAWSCKTLTLTVFQSLIKKLLPLIKA